MDFDTAFDMLIGHEGDYSRHPDDPGGETRFGVTRRVAMQEGYMGDMHVFPRETAKAIYRRRYWDAIQANTLPGQLRFAMFDAAVTLNQAPAYQSAVLASGRSFGTNGSVQASPFGSLAS